MTAPAPSPDRSAPVCVPLDPGRLNGTNINPVTLLATDYLNHFNEAIMLLELLPTAPECKEDFLAWRPISYCEHFQASRLKYRDLAIAAYEVADPIYRNEIDELSRHMNMILTATRDAMGHELSPQTLGVLAESTAHWLRPLVARAGAVINGEMASAPIGSETEPQETVDALFDREVEEVFQG